MKFRKFSDGNFPPEISELTTLLEIFYFRSPFPLPVIVSSLMDIFAVVLAWQITDLQAAATLVPLAAARQHVGYTITSSQLGSTSTVFTYCICLSIVTSVAVTLENSDKLLD